MPSRSYLANNGSEMPAEVQASGREDRALRRHAAGGGREERGALGVI